MKNYAGVAGKSHYRNTGVTSIIPEQHKFMHVYSGIRLTLFNMAYTQATV